MLIENKKYLHACGLYIEDNPVKAGLVEKSADWSHSSLDSMNESNLPDSLIDAYEPELLETINFQDKTFFTKSNIVGSELFKLQISEERFTINLSPVQAVGIFLPFCCFCSAVPFCATFFCFFSCFRFSLFFCRSGAGGRT